MKKTCSKCGEEKLLELFSMRSRGGKTPATARQSWCKACVAAKQRERLGQGEYRERLYAENRERAKENRAAQVEANRQQRMYHKALVYSFYGEKCACCGETEQAFLTIDHVNRDGSDHRKNKNVARDIYRWIVNNDYPDDFQILCFNCNCGRERNGGVCPHQEA